MLLNIVKIILPLLKNIIFLINKYIIGLKDNRGKKIENRDKAELIDAEKAELKLKETEDRIRRLEAENFMLKRLHEFQRRSIK